MDESLRNEVKDELAGGSGSRLKAVLGCLGVAMSSWYHRPVTERRRPGPAPQPVPAETADFIAATALEHPWYGYRKIGVICRWCRPSITDRMVYKVMQARRLLKVRRPRAAQLLEARKLCELLPTGPNQLWQMDVTYLYIAGYGWRYAVTVIDYYSRYLLAAHLVDSYSAQSAIEALDLALLEAEDLHGPLDQRPHLVTDNGSSFIARRFCRHIAGSFRQVRIQYRTPQQLGLLERFHQTLKDEEVYYRLYDSPEHCRQSLAAFRQRYNHCRPHWALRPTDGGDPMTPADVYLHAKTTRIPRWQGWAKGAMAKLDKLAAMDSEPLEKTA